MSEPVPGGIVSSVATGPVMRAGLLPGDVVRSVDGAPLRDVIDWMWLTDEVSFSLDVLRGGEPLTLPVERDHGQPLGVTFAQPLFDGIRECENACAFCIVSQLPPALRSSLYVRDDDFRLSFLSGNFVTLTNLEDGDLRRIVEQRLSPLHVSVHAIDPDVRRRLICATGEDRGLEHLDTLLRHGIEAHVQIVLVPGVNDGPVLAETLSYLAERDGVVSVGAVPMGFTSHQRRFDRSYDAGSALAVVEQLGSVQTAMRERRGHGWVYAADEFYLLSGAPLPGVADYDDFPQFENGIGMSSAFLSEFAEAFRGGEASVTLVTGVMFAPVLETLLRESGAASVRVLPVKNRLFGGNVAVTGLLGGRDIIDAIESDGGRGTYLVPDVVVNSDGLLLDDVPAPALSAGSGADVRVIGSDGFSLADALHRSTGRFPG